MMHLLKHNRAIVAIRRRRANNISMSYHLKRVYDPPADDDGYRVLVDRLWPRGIRKEDAKLDAWPRHVAPSKKLRQWFDHDPDKWDEMQRRYFAELDDDDEAQATATDLRSRARGGTVTLLFAAKDEQHNNAVALKRYLTGQHKR
jgi:uncharacterized protein YeaO (DUF488 family)